MRIVMKQKTTGLNETYILDTENIATGCLVKVFDRHWILLGSFVNKRKGSNDCMSMSQVTMLDARLIEVVSYFNLKVIKKAA